jgi:hypothetical protein
VLKTLNYIQWQLGHLNVINDLPDTDVQRATLINRATDVKSAMLTYIAVHICHEGNRLGLAGIVLGFGAYKLQETLRAQYLRGTKIAIPLNFSWRRQFKTSTPRSTILDTV